MAFACHKSLCLSPGRPHFISDCLSIFSLWFVFLSSSLVTRSFFFQYRRFALIVTGVCFVETNMMKYRRRACHSCPATANNRRWPATLRSAQMPRFFFLAVELSLGLRYNSLQL